MWSTIQRMSLQPVDHSRFVGRPPGKLGWQQLTAWPTAPPYGWSRQNEEIDGQAGRQRGWADQGIVVHSVTVDYVGRWEPWSSLPLLSCSRRSGCSSYKYSSLQSSQFYCCSTSLTVIATHLTLSIPIPPIAEKWIAANLQLIAINFVYHDNRQLKN